MHNGLWVWTVSGHFNQFSVNYSHIVALTCSVPLHNLCFESPLSQVMECQPVVRPACCSVDQSDLCTIPHLQINTHGQQELTQAGTTYNKWQFTIAVASAYLTTAAHGSNFHVMPSCYVQSGIHLPGLSRADADITKLTYKHLIPQSYSGAVQAKCWQRQWHNSCIFLLLLSFKGSLYWKQFSSQGAELFAEDCNWHRLEMIGCILCCWQLSLEGFHMQEGQKE